MIDNLPKKIKTAKFKEYLALTVSKIIYPMPGVIFSAAIPAYSFGLIDKVNPTIATASMLALIVMQIQLFKNGRPVHKIKTYLNKNMVRSITEKEDAITNSFRDGGLTDNILADFLTYKGNIGRTDDLMSTLSMNPDSVHHLMANIEKIFLADPQFKMKAEAFFNEHPPSIDWNNPRILAGLVKIGYKLQDADYLQLNQVFSNKEKTKAYLDTLIENIESCNIQKLYDSFAHYYNDELSDKYLPLLKNLCDTQHNPQLTENLNYIKNHQTSESITFQNVYADMLAIDKKSLSPQSLKMHDTNMALLLERSASLRASLEEENMKRLTVNQRILKHMKS